MILLPVHKLVSQLYISKPKLAIGHSKSKASVFHIEYYRYYTTHPHMPRLQTAVSI